MSRRDVEDRVRECYETWSGSYYDDYYGAGAAYPPVHRDILKTLISEAGVTRLLDAGCGPAPFLREIAGEGIEVYGFDLSPEMVAEARRVLGEHGVPSDHVWEGSVLDAKAFRAPDGAGSFDAAVCIGVLPHVPQDSDELVLANLRESVRPGGRVVVEARNQLFSLFTLNRYSLQFFLDDLIRQGALLERAGADGDAVRSALGTLRTHFRTDLPPVRRGPEGTVGYDDILSRTHNPFVLRGRFERAGFTDMRMLFYHYHPLPPMFEADLPELFRQEALAMEDPDDWRGYFMASAFFLVGRRA